LIRPTSLRTGRQSPNAHLRPVPEKLKIFSTAACVRFSLTGFNLQTLQMNKMIRPLRWQSLAAIALLIIGTPARLHAVEALLLQDAYVDNKNNGNLGSNGNLRVTKSGNQVCRSFLKFSLATLPAGITATNVTEARLRLWVDSNSNTLGSITMTPVTSAWDELTITNTTSGRLILSSPKLSNLHRPELRRNFRESCCSIEQLPFCASPISFAIDSLFSDPQQGRALNMKRRHALRQNY
jgi:hypothetical protein